MKIKDFSGIALLPEGSIVMDADGIVWKKCDDDLYIPSVVPSESPKISEDKFPVRVLFGGSEEEVFGSLNDNEYRTSSEDISVNGEVEEPLQETLEGLKSLLDDSYAENIELKAENKVLKSIIRLRLEVSVEKG